MGIKQFIKKAFDIREGEYKVSLFMFSYIFIIITVLLIIKPTVNALFLSESGVENLPFAFLLVALAAIISSFFYAKALIRFSLKKIIESTLGFSVVFLMVLGILLTSNSINAGILYFYYVWVAIYAVLAASQFWVLANLVYNIREAKRIFGFIGSGAILGGIFGGYLTSILVPLAGNGIIIFLAAALLITCIPLLGKIWQLRVQTLNDFKKTKRTGISGDKPLFLISKSPHLSYLAGIVAISVLVAKLVDYLFSDFAAKAITDADELAAFFAFWFSTFNVLSLIIQLFFTRRIVGVWGIGFSLALLPAGIFIGCVSFYIFPELALVIFIKLIDGSLKQSIQKSAMELLALPLSFDLKNRTKSFIDVVIDSVATGVAGCILIFVVKGLELPSHYIITLIALLGCLWFYLIYKVRVEYFNTFKKNLGLSNDKKSSHLKKKEAAQSVISGMRNVFETGSESQILFMLKKLMEINDKRFSDDVQKLLKHPSEKVKIAAIQNMYFLNDDSVVTEISNLLASNNEELIIATLEYLLLHASKDQAIVYNRHLNHPDDTISKAALLCLAREARDNQKLKEQYKLGKLIAIALTDVSSLKAPKKQLISLLKVIGAANIQKFHFFIEKQLHSDDPEIVQNAIQSAGVSINPVFLPLLVPFLANKTYRPITTEALLNYGSKILPELYGYLDPEKLSPEIGRQIPLVIKAFQNQESIAYLMKISSHENLSIRLSAIQALYELKKGSKTLKFDSHKVVKAIFAECKLHHQTLSAMHTQIIISYKNRKKSRKEINDEERDARASLLELLERRIDAGLERIFKLLGLKYDPEDIEFVYEGLKSEKQELQANAIDYLDHLLTGNLKRRLLPIVENTILDTSSDDILQKITHKIPSEIECFQLLLEANDLKVKLAVLYLIRKQKDIKYLPLINKCMESKNVKLRTFAEEAFKELKGVV